MHVLELDAPLERACIDLGANRRQPIDNLRAFGIGQHLYCREHACVCNRARYILGKQALIERHRSGKRFDERIGGL